MVRISDLLVKKNISSPDVCLKSGADITVGVKDSNGKSERGLQ